MNLDLQEGLVLVFNEKIGCIPDGEWVIVRKTVRKKDDNYYTFGIVKKFVGLGCLNELDVINAIENGSITNTKKIIKVPKTKVKKRRV